MAECFSFHRSSEHMKTAEIKLTLSTRTRDTYQRRVTCKIAQSRERRGYRYPTRIKILLHRLTDTSAIA